MGFKVAVVGATGNVGREMLNILSERRFPADEVVALASRKSMGVEVSYGDKTLKCKSLDQYDFSDVDICLMSAGGSVSKEWSPKIGAQGAVVIDNSSQWRMDPDVPLIVPEVNAAAVEGFRKKNIIANPNCSTAQLVVALKPLHDKAKIKRVVVSTYQSVSGAGKDGMDEISLSGETLVGELRDGEIREYRVHPSDFGLPVYDSRVLKVANRDESVQCIQRALANEDGPVRDIVLLNAGAALYCAGVAESIADGVKRAREAVASGAAMAKLSQFVAVSHQLKDVV